MTPMELPRWLGGWSFAWRGLEIHLGAIDPNNTIHKSGLFRCLKVGPLKLVWLP